MQGLTETTVLVRGFEAASAVVAEANRTPEDTTDVHGPDVTTGGWWSVALTTRRELCDLLFAVGDVPGMAIQGGGAPMALVALADREGIDCFLVGASGEFAPPGRDTARGDAARLVRWSASAPKSLSERAARRLFANPEGSKGFEIAAALLKRLGFATARRGEPWEDLPGATDGVYFEPMFLGTQRYDARRYRWRFARLRGGAGMWDFDGPTQPVERWEGPGLEPDDQAEKRWFELVAMPALKTMVLDGERAWARFDSKAPGTAGPPLLFLLHRSPTGVVTELNCDQPYNTSWQQSSGVMHVPKMYAHNHGVFGPEDECTPPHTLHYALPNRDLDDAKRAATLQWPPNGNLQWTDLPHDVCRYLLDTCEYIHSLQPPR